jgi:hypothetical protein
MEHEELTKAGYVPVDTGRTVTLPRKDGSVEVASVREWVPGPKP